jgi:hypothetical protein
LDELSANSLLRVPRLKTLWEAIPLEVFQNIDKELKDNTYQSIIKSFSRIEKHFENPGPEMDKVFKKLISSDPQVLKYLSY